VLRFLVIFFIKDGILEILFENAIKYFTCMVLFLCLAKHWDVFGKQVKS